MNETVIEQKHDLHHGSLLPTILIALSLCFFFIYQLSAIYETRSQLKTQFTTVNQQIDQQLAGSIKIQAELESLARDLIDLSNKGNADAKIIVEKYGIKVNAPAAGPTPAR